MSGLSETLLYVLNANRVVRVIIYFVYEKRTGQNPTECTDGRSVPVGRGEGRRMWLGVKIFVVESFPNWTLNIGETFSIRFKRRTREIGRNIR